MKNEIEKSSGTEACAVPAWASNAIFYQIFPDRFANGIKSNDPDDVQPWDSEPNGQDRIGGDLAGVRKHFDYLTDLGINAIYFNPLFTSESNHGYDTTDYDTIDPRFGTAEQFQRLVKEAHERDWHIILDGVFPHTSTAFAAFQDVVQKGEPSKFKDWYHIKSFPVKVEDGQDTYEAWGGYYGMPLLNFDNPDVRKFLLDVGAKWIKEAGIDGWRLDSAERPPHDFWQAFRKVVKAANPDAYLVGEIWDNAHEWMQGDEFDAVMNYKWRGAVYTFFAQNEMTPTDFDDTLGTIRRSYTPQATNMMFNMLSSHDVDRLVTRCGGDPLKIGQCVLMQMAYPGTPCIYYGDEIGMEGNADPNNRCGMNWNRNEWNTGLRDFYKRLIRLRHEKEALRCGDYQTVLLHDEKGLFGFLRKSGRQRVLALFNTSDAAQCAELPLSVVGHIAYKDWLDTGADIEAGGETLTVSLPGAGHGTAGAWLKVRERQGLFCRSCRYSISGGGRAKAGRRLARKARMPSCPSAPTRRAAMQSAVRSAAASGVFPARSRRSCLAAATATGPVCRTASHFRARAASSSDMGTTCCTSPMRSASCAVIRSPVTKQRPRRPHPDLFHHIRPDHGGNQTEPHFAERETGFLRRNRHIAYGSQPCPAPDSRAIDSRYRDVRTVGNRGEHRLQTAGVLAVLCLGIVRHAPHVRKVGPRTKRRPAARQDDGSQRGVRAPRMKDSGEFGNQGIIESVMHGGAIQRNRSDIGLDSRLQAGGFCHGLFLRRRGLREWTGNAGRNFAPPALLYTVTGIPPALSRSASRIVSSVLCPDNILWEASLLASLPVRRVSRTTGARAAACCTRQAAKKRTTGWACETGIGGPDAEPSGILLEEMPHDPFAPPVFRFRAVHRPVRSASRFPPVRRAVSA